MAPRALHLETVSALHDMALRSRNVVIAESLEYLLDEMLSRMPLNIANSIWYMHMDYSIQM